MRPGALCAAVTLLAACSPALDWREVRPEGSTARAMFPCRPASQERSIALAGAQVEMRLFVCSAADTVHALGFADVADPARVGPALEEMARAARGNVRGGDAAAAQPASVPGMTPHPAASQWRVAGTLPDGREVEERAVFFSHGTRVYQATMIGRRLNLQAEEEFFGGLRVGP